MFSDIGTLSFWLYGILLSLTGIAMVIAFYYIQKGYDLEKLSKMIELFKYSIVTVSIATVTLIISDLYKEREQQLKELEYFDRYTNDVKNADGIQARYELTKYLSIVAPNGELKKSWERYFDSLKIEYQEYLLLKNQKQLLDTVKNPTKQELIKKIELNGKLIQKNAPLIGNQNTQPHSLEPVTKAVECYIHFADKNGFPIGDILSAKIRLLNKNRKIELTYIYDFSDIKPIKIFPGNYSISVEFKGGLYEQTIQIKHGMEQPITFNLDTVYLP